MSWLKRFKRWLLRETPSAIFDRELTKNPLREFVYLDEVSLQSLLSSKKGEMTSSTSTQMTESVEAEIRSSASAGTTGIGKAEFGSRFQTQNSSTLQTAKKATVQSWFRELDKVPMLRALETVRQVQPFKSNTELTGCDNHSISICADALARGDVVEFRVRLAADPIFHLVTLVSEFKAMAEAYPTMMAEIGGLEQFNEIEGISRVLQRLLAGLVPVRARVLDYVVVKIDNTEYVVHVDAIRDLEIEYKPLEIGCVTELVAYWKDIRRVLFSDAEFTMLCRVAKDGIQKTWTPIKLADLLKKLVPDLSAQMDNAARFMFDASRRETVVADTKPPFRRVLENYTTTFSVEMSVDFTEQQQVKINRKIDDFEQTGPMVSEQSDTLKAFGGFLSDLSKQEIEPQKALELREEARRTSDFPYFAPPSAGSTPVPRHFDDTSDDERFLDVEVVAMYW